MNTELKSETPRTDGFANDISKEEIIRNLASTFIVPIVFARTLERENNELKEKMEAEIQHGNRWEEDCTALCEALGEPVNEETVDGAVNRAAEKIETLKAARVAAERENNNLRRQLTIARAALGVCYADAAIVNHQVLAEGGFPQVAQNLQNIERVSRQAISQLTEAKAK